MSKGLPEKDYPTTLDELVPNQFELFDDHIWPMALELRICKPQDTVTTLAHSFLDRLNTEHELSVRPVHPREVASAEFGQLCVMLDNIAAIESGDHSLSPEEAATARRVAVAGANHWAPMVYGYLLCLLDSTRETVRRGANGRRLIGATTRERTRGAAEPYRGQMSRFRAAPFIAEKIGISPARVLKLLSQLYPGDAWDKSID